MRINKAFSFLIIIAITGTISYSCKKTTSQLQRDQEVDYIKKYVEKYLPGIKPTASGLYYKELFAGTDTLTKDSIKAGDVIKIFYKGYLIQDTVGLGIKTGRIFDTSGDYEPFSFKVGGGAVITGWDEAIRMMKDGGEAIWVIPSRLAYSGQAQNTIPAYSPLVFHVRIYAVIRSSYIPPVIEKKPPGPF
jgi:FKBP-type peptidyl-prolyl cis-trans isomerase FkpA